MQHLSPERLAALTDDPPTPQEAEHLAACAECARERQAHRALLSLAAAERDAIAAPITDWSAIAGAMRLEAAPRRRLGSWRVAGQVAAALLLVAGGVVAGRRSVEAPAVLAPVAAAGDATPAPQPADANDPSAIAVSGTTTPDSLVPDYRSVEEARAALTRYEVAYQNAAAYLAAHDSSTRVPTSEAYRTRLAALDQVGKAMRRAMKDAPYDPVINGYYLTTMGQREATMRQLNTALPSGVRLTSF